MLYIHIQKKIIQFFQSSKIKIKNENLFYIIDNDIDIFYLKIIEFILEIHRKSCFNAN